MNACSNNARAEWWRHWPLVLAATSTFSLVALPPISFGVMVSPIEQDIGWSRTEIASGPLLSSFMTIALGTLAGWAVDRVGPRTVGFIASILLCGSLAMLSNVNGQLWLWWLLWSVNGLASAAVPPCVLMPISLTFTAGRGLAIAVVLSGSGISSFIAPSLTNTLVEAYGWRVAYICLASIWAVFVLPMAMWFLRSPREEVARAATQAPAVTIVGLTVAQGFATPAFYKLAMAALTGTFAGTALILNIVPVLRWTGLPGATAAAIAGSIGIATIVGRIIGGGLIDRFSARAVATIASATSVGLPSVLLLFPGSIPASLGAVALYGLMGGVLMPAIAYLTGRYLGQRSFGTLYGTINAAGSIGLGCGLMLANVIYDRTQSYELVLWATVPLFVLGSVLFASLGPYPEFNRKKGELDCGHNLNA